MATNQDVNLILGEVWEIICTCHDSSGTLMDVAAAEWRLASTASRLLMATDLDNITILNPGVVSISVPPSTQATANVQPGSFTHELFVTGNNSVGSIQITGRAMVTDSLKHKYP